MRKHSFVISAIILALGGFFAKAIGAIYKIPLTNILGSSGMGLYYLVFPIYSLIITICSSGMSVALSTEISKCRKIRNSYNEHKLLRVALVITFIISLIFAIIVVFLSKSIASLQGNINAYVGYISISPAIIISSIIATLRGYFQGIENMVPTTVSLIIEQVVKLSIGLILAHKLCVYGVGYAVLGAIIGVTFSEVVAFIIIVINYLSYKGQLHYNYKNLFFKNKRKKTNKCLIKSKQPLKFHKNNNEKKLYKSRRESVRYTTKVSIQKLFKSSIFNTMSSIVIPIATMLDSFMIINIMINSGYSSAISTSLYGLLGGVVQSLTSLPIIVISGIATSLVPSLSGLVAQNDSNEIRHKTLFFIKITWILSLVMFVIMFVYAEDYIQFLYGDGLSNLVIDEYYYLVKMMKINSISIIYYAFMQTFISIFQSIGKPFVPFIVLSMGLVFRTLFVYVLTSKVNINIFGGIIANILFLIVSVILMAIWLKRYMKFDVDFFRNLLSPMVIGVFIFLFMTFANWSLKYEINYFASMLITALIGLIIYLLAIYFGKTFTNKEKKYLNFKKKSFIKGKK